MLTRSLLATLFAAGLASAADAATVTFDEAGFLAQSSNPVTTTSNGGAPYNTYTSYTLSNATVTFDQPMTLLAPLSGWGPWINGYTGDILDSTGNAVTLTFSQPLSYFGVEVSPDVALSLVGATTENWTVTLTNQDGSSTTSTLTGSYSADLNPVQFIGFAGGPVTSMTISADNTTDLALGNFTSVPEPASLLLLGAGSLGLAAVRRRYAR